MDTDKWVNAFNRVVCSFFMSNDVKNRDKCTRFSKSEKTRPQGGFGMKERLINSLLVAIGGAAGSLLRYLVSIIIPIQPYYTLAVNITGSFLLGYFMIIFAIPKHKKLKLILGTGFCGGFTTMSTFSLEIYKMSFLFAMVYVATTLVLSFMFVLLGMKLAKYSIKEGAQS